MTTIYAYFDTITRNTNVYLTQTVLVMIKLKLRINCFLWPHNNVEPRSLINNSAYTHSNVLSQILGCQHGYQVGGSTCVWRTEIDVSCCFLRHHLPWFLRQDLSLRLKLAQLAQADKPRQLQGSACLPTSSVLKHMSLCPASFAFPRIGLKLSWLQDKHCTNQITSPSLTLVSFICFAFETFLFILSISCTHIQVR